MNRCSAHKEIFVFSHYAYGDPLPIWARYYDTHGSTVDIEDAASVYIQCQRKEGHEGVHLAHGFAPWNDND